MTEDVLSEREQRLYREATALHQEVVKLKKQLEVAERNFEQVQSKRLRLVERLKDMEESNRQLVAQVNEEDEEVEELRRHAESMQHERDEYYAELEVLRGRIVKALGRVATMDFDAEGTVDDMCRLLKGETS
jgi:chromosome segregation ATPase